MPDAPRRARRRRLPVRVSLTLWGVGVLGVILLALGLAVRFTVRAYLLSSVDRELATRAAHFRANLTGRRPPPHSAPRSALPPLPPARKSGSESDDPYMPRVFDRDGKSRNPFREAHAPWDAGAVKAALTGEGFYTRVVARGQTLRLITVPVRDANGAVDGALQMAFPLTDIERGLAAVDRTLLGLLPLALLATVVGGALLTARAIRPIEEALAQEKRFVSDASHELRTPVAIIRAAADLGMEDDPEDPGRARRALERIDAAAERARRIVDDLLLLARAEGSERRSGAVALSLDRRLVPAADLLCETAALFEPVRGGRTVAVDVAPDGLLVLADRYHLGRALANLVDNAVRHTDPDGGRITLSGHPAPGGFVRLAVADDGDGIAADHLPHVFRRFYRGAAAAAHRTGRGGGSTGLGLSIVRAVVEAHQGEITLRSTPGAGTEIVLILPGTKNFR